MIDFYAILRYYQIVEGFHDTVKALVFLFWMRASGYGFLPLQK